MNATVIDPTVTQQARGRRGRAGRADRSGRAERPGRSGRRGHAGQAGRAHAALAELEPSANEAMVPAPGLLGRGAEIVAGFLRFCETGDNVRVVKRLVRVSNDDPAQAALVDAYVVDSLVRPYVERVRLTDAWPRARLAFSQLIGLSVSRYILREEPIASADHATLAAWAGPAIDYVLRGELGGEAGGSFDAVSPSSAGRPAPSIAPSAA